MEIIPDKYLYRGDNTKLHVILFQLFLYHMYLSVFPFNNCWEGIESGQGQGPFCGHKKPQSYRLACITLYQEGRKRTELEVPSTLKFLKPIEEMKIQAEVAILRNQLHCITPHSGHSKELEKLISRTWIESFQKEKKIYQQGPPELPKEAMLGSQPRRLQWLHSELLWRSRKIVKPMLVNISSMKFSVAYSMQSSPQVFKGLDLLY